MDMKPGVRFGRLTVVQDRGAKCVECRCDCGRVKITSRRYLRRGWTTSCGCLHREMLSKMATTHGGSGSRLHRIWKGIKTRCFNKNRPQAKDYALRGITLCEDWHDYCKFRDWALSHGYSESLTIDRIDNNGPYSPENCRWVTHGVQNRNRRNTIVFNYNGKEYRAIKDLCFDLGLEYTRVLRRIKRGWNIEESLEPGVYKSGPRRKGQSRRERLRCKNTFME